MDDNSDLPAMWKDVEEDMTLRTLHTRASLASGPVLLTCAGVMALLGQEAVALWLLIVGTVVSMYWPLLVNVAYEEGRR